MIWDQPPQADVADQNSRIETNIGRQPDGLAVACLDQATNVQLLGEAKEAGVNVMTFNSFCSDDFPFVGQKNSYQDGYDLGKFLFEHIGGEGKVGILSGSLTATDHVERINGFKDAMKDYPNVEVVFEQPDNDVLEDAVTLTENALQANPDIKGFFGSNASNPIGIARAVANAGKAGEIAIVGMDDLPEAVRLRLRRHDHRAQGAAAVGHRLLVGPLHGGDEREPHDPVGPQHRLALHHQGRLHQLIA